MLKIAISMTMPEWRWRRPTGRGSTPMTTFNRHLSEDEAATELAAFDVLCTMRERMALPRSLIERLPI